MALCTKFARNGLLTTLDEAEALEKEAVWLLLDLPFDRALCQSNLGDVLAVRYSHLRQPENFSEVIDLHQNALVTLAEHPYRFSVLSNLASAFVARFHCTEELADLDHGITLHREVLEALRASDSDEIHLSRSSCMDRLAKALRLRKHSTDLEEAVMLHREALSNLPSNHQNLERASFLDEFATTLQAQFLRSQAQEHLAMAIDLRREALSFSPLDEVDQAFFLNGLAKAVQARFELDRVRSDLDETISLHREAIARTPADLPIRVSYLGDLANASLRRFKEIDQPQDLDEAVLLSREVLALQPSAHRTPASWLNLAIALRTLFERDGLPKDLEESIALLREACSAFPSDHTISVNLALSLIGMYDLAKEVSYMDEAVAAFRMSMAYGSITDLEAVKTWAHHADIANHESALEAYKMALDLTRTAMLSPNLKTRYQRLALGSDGIARNAAACAVRLERFDAAVELLEEGRGMFWSQVLQIRTPLDELRRVAPELAEKLSSVSRALDQAIQYDLPSELPREGFSVDEEAVRYRRLCEVWSATIDKVRGLNGFEDFLRPKNLGKLLHAAVNGPIVVLNSGETSCAALILTSSDVKHVPLSDIRPEDAEILVQTITAITDGSTDVFDADLIARNAPPPGSLARRLLDRLLKADTADGGSRRKAVLRRRGTVVDPNHALQCILAELWGAVVEPVVRCLNLQVSG